MKKRIIFISVFLVAVSINLYNFTDLFGDTAIPKFRPFGTSTTFSDSTNYVTLNKGLYIQDSLKVAKDLYIGTKGGSIYLDTNRDGKIFYNGYTFTLQNNKISTMLLSSSGGIKLTGTTEKIFLEGYAGLDLFDANDIGIILRNLNEDTLRLVSGSVSINRTGQIKLPSDTASDYDGNNSITLNRQSGRILTKSLTTAALGDYTLTLVNSLISANTIVICQPSTGSLTTGIALVRAAVSGSGSATILIYNASSSAAFNGTVGFNYVLFN